jgi:hypothetical protein
VHWLDKDPRPNGGNADEETVGLLVRQASWLHRCAHYICAHSWVQKGFALMQWKHPGCPVPRLAFLPNTPAAFGPERHRLITDTIRKLARVNAGQKWPLKQEKQAGHACGQPLDVVPTRKGKFMPLFDLKHVHAPKAYIVSLCWISGSATAGGAHVCSIGYATREARGRLGMGGVLNGKASIM